MSKHYNILTGTLRYEIGNTITETFSQSYQDIFVLSVLNGKRNGTYLEIGCNVPDYTNNTYLLSKTFNWTGVSIDCIDSLQSAWTIQRSTDKFIICDALTVDYKQMLDENFGGQKVIDYLQCDLEPPLNTLAALKRLPHNEYRFKVITFETDVYTGSEGQGVREESRKFLIDLGYELIIGDVLFSYNGISNPYEDWWVAPELVDMNVANNIKMQTTHTQDPLKLLVLKQLNADKYDF